MDLKKIIFITVIGLYIFAAALATERPESLADDLEAADIFQPNTNLSAILTTLSSPTTTLSPTLPVFTVPDTTSTSDDRISKPKFELNNIICANGGKCMFAVQPELSKQRAATLKSISLNWPGWCSGSDHVTEGCCEALRDKFNKKHLSIAETTISSDYVQKITQLLNDAGCTQFYCNNQTCGHIGCKVRDCPQPSPSPPSSTWPSDVTTSPAHQGEESSMESDPGDDAAASSGKSGSTTIIIIVVSCVVAFLAGIGGALLITCLRKRWRAERGRGNADAGNKRSTELNTLSQTKPDTQTPTPTNNNSDYSATRPPSLSEHEYSCITDPSLALKHTTETTKPPNHVSPVRHLPHDRKLPTAPPPLAETASRDNTAEGERTEGDYTLARRPVEEGEFCLEKCEDRNVSSLPENRDSGEGYFILEENGKQRENKLTKNSETTDQYFVLETERKAEGAQVDDLKTTSQPERAINERERNLLRVSAEAECYSPLDLSSRNAEDSEYTVLELSEMESKKREASRDYLEVIPDYVLSKPIV